MEGMINAREARDRCLQALTECASVKDRRQLWRAAMAYNRQIRENGGAGTALERDAGQPLARPKGGSRPRELEAW